MTRRAGLIDVWDHHTFDAELRGDLDAHAELIRNYYLTSRLLWLERETSDNTGPYPENPYTGEFIWIEEHIARLMEARTIRAWHYTRTTNGEVATVRRDGVYLSSLDSIRVRLAAQVKAGAFSEEVSDRLFTDSPFQSEQLGSRSDKFWMVSHPAVIDDGRVELLLESWGGESAYFWQRDPEIQALLRRIGRPRVLEIAMPLVHSRHSFSAAEAVVATYGRTLGCRPDKGAFDLYALRSLPAEHALAVHSEGEPNYDNMARGYPARFLDVRLADVGDELVAAITP